MTPLNPIEIFLQPGDHYFGEKDTRIRTVLGSCVSLTFWHPQLLVGGMCHYMLPKREMERRDPAGPQPDGRYADEALLLLMREMNGVGVPHREYQVKMFGGGNMFPAANKQRETHVGQRNIEVARSLIGKHGFSCVAEHLGGIGHRNVIFDVWNGDVWVRHNETLPKAKAGERRLG